MLPLDCELRAITMSSSYFRGKVENFLVCNGLRLEDTDYFTGVYVDDELKACGGLAEDTIKCIAVSPELRGQNITNTIISHLISVVLSRGYKNVKVYTKPENEQMFTSLGFNIVGKSSQALFLENNPTILADYQSYLSQFGDRAGSKGVIVMNCNPMTKGHLYLIDKARREVDNLFILPLAEHPSNMFTYQERTEIISEAVADMENVTLLKGSHYTISASTFPSYFIKKADDAANAQIELDIAIFKNVIAPALKCDVRFVGSEPIDKLTARYNELMKSALPEAGIKVVEINRICSDTLLQHPISASAIRNNIAEGDNAGNLLDAAKHSLPYILAKMACNALRAELYTTPKPGLVDKTDNGSHKDMDLHLMERSIDALYPYFIEIGKMSISGTLPSASSLKECGIRAENAMLKATNGVNTHRGALFSIGLAIAAAAHILSNDISPTSENIRETISLIAKDFLPSSDTHGDSVKKAYSVSGALENAMTGYAQLFNDWLPFYRNNKGSDQKLLLILRIMSQLEDTNIYYRGGLEGIAFAKEEAEALLSHFSIKGMGKLNTEFIARNLSPGGAADMMALTIFLDSITTNHTNLKSITNG